MYDLDDPSFLKISHSYGDLDPSNTYDSWAHPSPQPKRHLDRLSRFCRDH